MCTDQRPCTLGTVIRTAIREHYPDRKAVTEEEELGLLIASHFQWDGPAILRAASAALEDANFHDECAAVEQMIRNVQKRFTR